ncbi:MAG: PAS domain-containing protein [candidate division Zixibacteria bacterium]|nr:PAS domain-containing protein [candidate division Zixibacteria bacterium]
MISDFIIRRRSVLIIALLFGAAILILAYSGVRSSRQNMLKLLTADGESLLQSLIISAQNNVAASGIVERATAEHLVDIAALISRLIDINPALQDSLEVLARRYHLERIDITDSSRLIIASSWSETVGDAISAEDDLQAVLDSVLTGRAEIAIATPQPSVLPREDYVKVAVNANVGVVLLQALTRKLTDYQESLGIGYLVRQLGGQRGVNYVVLQSDSGIVLASRSVGWMVAVEADTFLSEAVIHGRMVSRIHQFQGQPVLEVVRAFKSDALPSALFRLGMSLESYQELYSSSLRQLAILSVVLFVLGLVGSWAAISSRKLRRTATSLQELENITNEIIDSLEAAVIAIDRTGKITIFNPRAQQLFSLSARAVLGRPYSAIFADDKLFLGQLSKETASVLRGEVTLTRENDEPLHLLISAVPIHAADDTFSGAVSLVYDLTDMKRLQESVRTSERLSELGNLAAGVAHEIRNPLNAISIATQRLRHEFKPVDNVAEYENFLKTITAEIDRLNAIVRDFLALARGGKIEKVFVDLKEYLNNIASLIRLETDKKDISLIIDVEPALQVGIDKLEMKKVILNLLRNAIEAAGRQGSVGIKAHKTDTGKVEIRVSNSGEPIPAEIQQRIFQPYFTTKREGTGLGLAICQRIIADHGGRLELLPGEPTTFRITL